MVTATITQPFTKTNGLPTNKSTALLQDDSEAVQVRFTTTESEYRISDAPLLVPLNLRRYGLSEVLNHLLGLEKHVPFDFLANGKFLRTSLRGYLQRENLSAEEILELEYVICIAPPSLERKIEQDDWVSSLESHENGTVLVGSYDSVVRVWTREGDLVASGKGHTKPIKSVTWGPDANSAYSGSQDTYIYAWKRKNDESKFKPFIRYEGHTGTVMDVKYHEDSDMLVSGSWDGSIKLWRGAPDDESVMTSLSTSRSSKRRKIDTKVHKNVPVHTFVGHTSCITKLALSPDDPSELYSASWDGSLRHWDIAQGITLRTCLTDGAFTDLSVGEERPILSSHMDGCVRVWDARDGQNTQAQLRCSDDVVSTVCWSPHDSTRFVVGNFTGKLRFYDLRSTSHIPLYEIKLDIPTEKPEEETKEYYVHKLELDEEDKNDGDTTYIEPKMKVLACEWKDDVIVGSEDSKLRIYRTKGRQEGSGMED